MNDTFITKGLQSPNAYGPMTSGQMFERAFRLLRDNFWLYAGIMLILIGVEIVVGGVLGGSGWWMNRIVYGAPLVHFLVLFPIGVVGAVVLFILFQIVQGALFAATRARLASIPMSVGDACKLAADRLGKLFGISLLVAIRVIGYLILLYILFAVVAVVAALMMGGFAQLAGEIPFRSGATGHAGIALAAVVFVLAFLIVYCIALFWLIVRYALCIPVAMAENLSVATSIQRSIHLSRGSRGRLYALFFSVFCLYCAIFVITVPLQMMFAFGGTMHSSIGAMATGGVASLLGIFRFIVSAIIFAWIGIATALCYFDLLVRKEGFGVAMMTSANPNVTASSDAPDLQPGDSPST